MADVWIAVSVNGGLWARYSTTGENVSSHAGWVPHGVPTAFCNVNGSR